MESISVNMTLLFSLFSLLAAGLGFAVAKTKSTKRQTQLETTLKETESELQRKVAEQTSIELEIKSLNEQVSSLNQEKVQLTTRLELTDKTLLQEQQKSLNLEQKLEEANQLKHQAEKANETAQTETRGLKAKAEDLNDRLKGSQSDIETERTQHNETKAKLADEAKRAEGLSTNIKKSEEHLSELRANHQLQTEELKQLQKQFQSLNEEYTELKTSLEERQLSHEREVNNFNKQKDELKKDFENLANKIFEEKGKTFSQTNQQHIDSMLKPFKEQIEGFQKRVNYVHDESLKGNAHLNAEIKKVLEVGLKMSSEANNLTSALKGDSQQRGAWGEAQLKRTLEMSGLIEDAHFEVQSAFKDNEGKSKQTDYLIKLPGNKHIIIDSKVSLIDYDRAVSAETPEAHAIAMRDHVKSVKKHIDDLASKDYTNLVGMRSPDFVLMFMPIEPAYIDALKANKDLFAYGYEKHIVLVSHTTLIPILRTVANLWVMENSNQEARELSEKAGDIYNKVCLVADNLKKLGGTLGTVSTHYNNTVKALVGQQGLHGKVERFNKLSNKVSKAMPQLEPIHNDFETERLSMIVEPINESELEAPNAIETAVKSEP